MAARGIEVGEKGWFFSGRKRLLLELVDWLNTAEHGVRIVTGPPGAGKSAVMGRIATLSDAQCRQEAIDAGVVKEGEDVVPPVGAIDVAVHAKGKTLYDCARALAKGLGVEISQDVSVDLERFVREIGKLDRKITVMIDALDEAAGRQGSTIASQLIVPLGSLLRVRVLVGSRRTLDGAVRSKSARKDGFFPVANGCCSDAFAKPTRLLRYPAPGYPGQTHPQITTVTYDDAEQISDIKRDPEGPNHRPDFIFVTISSG